MNRYLGNCLESDSIIQLLPSDSFRSGLIVDAVVFTPPDNFAVTAAAVSSPSTPFTFDLTIPPCTMSYALDLATDHQIQYLVLSLPFILSVFAFVIVLLGARRLL